ncbi:MAG: type II toxin-antitoxin system PemK/MazF family toxin [Deltaproteobacteria bacterium]|nr:type II toxin-antitoxin system PemK/MazF family toxin [Deltaproteobacteria bacterium]
MICNLQEDFFLSVHLNFNTSKTIHAPISTSVRNIPSEVFLSKPDGMMKNCAINLDHIQTVSKGKIGSIITTLPQDKLKQVRDAVQFALDL